MTDGEILAGLRTRDPAALSDLVKTYAQPVYALVQQILTDSGGRAAVSRDVEECVSDAFYAAWMRAEQYDPERAPLRTWLLIQAKYCALDRRRRGQRNAVVLSALAGTFPDPGPGPEERLATAEKRQELQEALAQLAPLDHQLVYRRYFLGERVEAIAADLGLTRQAADNRLWRARKALRAWLQKEPDGEVAGS